MFVLLSPAKRLNEGPASDALPFTEAAMLGEASTLVKVARKLSKSDLSKLMSISDTLADLNQQRFKSWSLPFDSDTAKQAALSFAGDTYVGLDAPTLAPEDLEYAQQHLGILSGLYGLLRPLDLMRPYRLEMGSRLKNKNGTNLYQFWGEKITEHINQATESHAERIVVNCASNEYFKAVKRAKLQGTLVEPQFKEIKNGVPKMIGFTAKRARGMMARYIIQNRIESLDDLKKFNVAGYSYQDELSSEEQFVFTRPA